jgi:hypothetical protein
MSIFMLISIIPHAIAQAVSHQRLAVEAQIHFEDSLCSFSSKQISSSSDLPLNTEVVLCQVTFYQCLILLLSGSPRLGPVAAEVLMDAVAPICKSKE